MSYMSNMVNTLTGCLSYIHLLKNADKVICMKLSTKFLIYEVH